VLQPEAIDAAVAAAIVAFARQVARRAKLLALLTPVIGPAGLGESGDRRIAAAAKAAAGQRVGAARSEINRALAQRQQSSNGT